MAFILDLPVFVSYTFFLYSYTFRHDYRSIIKITQKGKVSCYEHKDQNLPSNSIRLILFLV